MSQDITQLKTGKYSKLLFNMKINFEKCNNLRGEFDQESPFFDDFYFALGRIF